MRVPYCEVRLTEKIQVAGLESGKIERSAEALREYQSPDIFSPTNYIKIFGKCRVPGVTWNLVYDT
jgi:hypothetical protein